MSVRRLPWIALGCVLTFSCASTHAPTRWLPEPEDAPGDVFGCWIEMTTDREELRGELIALSGDTLYVADTSLHAIDTTHITRARVVMFSSEAMMALGTTVGTLSTPFTNGAYMIFTAPLWLIGGSIATSSRSFDPIIDYPDQPLRAFARFARFPQGLPAGLDRSVLRMKSPTP